MCRHGEAKPKGGAGSAQWNVRSRIDFSTLDRMTSSATNPLMSTPALRRYSLALGRDVPMGFKGLMGVFLVRDLPAMGLLIALALVYPTLLVAEPKQLDADDVRTSFLYAVVFTPLLETALFILIALLLPKGLRQQSSSERKQQIKVVWVSVLVGVAFGFLHDGTIVRVAWASWGGFLMFALLLEHWSRGMPDRGIVLAWGLHVIHNLTAFMLVRVLLT